MLGPVLSAEKKGEVKTWKDLFTEPVETVYIIMKDGMIFQHSNQNEVMVEMSIGRLEKKLRKVKGKNYSIKEIRTVIHNHRRKNFFTRADYRQYEMLKKYGFKGLFLMYCHRTNKVYDIEDKTK